MHSVKQSMGLILMIDTFIGNYDFNYKGKFNYFMKIIVIRIIKNINLFK
jgi:hypothetical protein